MTILVPCTSSNVVSSACHSYMSVAVISSKNLLFKPQVDATPDQKPRSVLSGMEPRKGHFLSFIREKKL